jgi:hypothetical protein
MASLKIDGMPNVVEARCKACVNTIGTSSDCSTIAVDRFYNTRDKSLFQSLGTAAFRIEKLKIKIKLYIFFVHGIHCAHALVLLPFPPISLLTLPSSSFSSPSSVVLFNSSSLPHSASQRQA